MDEKAEENNVADVVQLKSVLANIPKEQLDNILSGFGYSSAPLLKFLESEQGNRFADKCISVFESLQKSITEKNHKSGNIEQFVKLCVILGIVAAVSLLSHFGKFDPSIGVLFGTITGYLFSKKTKDGL